MPIVETKSPSSGNTRTGNVMKMLLAFAFSAAFAGTAIADDGIKDGYAPFSKKNSVLACKHAPDKRITRENFDKVFPALSVYVYEKWKSGIVARAYFLRTVDEGIVLIINDGQGSEGKSLAEGVMEDIVKLFANSNVPLKASCVIHDIGPLWLGDTGK